MIISYNIFWDLYIYVFCLGSRLSPPISYISIMSICFFKVRDKTRVWMLEGADTLPPVGHTFCWYSLLWVLRQDTSSPCSMQCVLTRTLTAKWVTSTCMCSLWEIWCGTQSIWFCAPSSIPKAAHSLRAKLWKTFVNIISHRRNWAILLHRR